MKRQRGRGGRKPNGQANRHFESNGPDVKIRGAASHICEKYQQLARDAASAGDRVMAENYLQHAEHYFRLVQSAQRTQRERDGEAEAANGAAQPEDAATEANGLQEAAKNGDAMGADSGPMQLVTPETEGLVSDDASAEPAPAPARRTRARRSRASNGAAAAETAEAREALDAASDAADTGA